MDEEEAVKIFDLVVRGKLLPATLDKLVPLSFIGSAAVSFYKAKVKLMDQLGMTEDQRKATLADGQDAGRMLLEIEGRIGELLENRPKGKYSKPDATTTKGVKLPEGVSEKQSHHAQAIHRNPAAVAAVIKEAEENEDIPTKTAVLNRIRYETEKQRSSKQKEKDALEMTISGIEYQGKLMRVLDILPTRPPRELNDKDFAAIRGLVAIIFKRLEAFNDVRTQIGK